MGFRTLPTDQMGKADEIPFPHPSQAKISGPGETGVFKTEMNKAWASPLSQGSKPQKAELPA